MRSFRLSLPDDAGKYFDSESRVLEAPMTIRVADQVCGDLLGRLVLWGEGGALGAGLCTPARPLACFQSPGLHVCCPPQQPLHSGDEGRGIAGQRASEPCPGPPGLSPAPRHSVPHTHRHTCSHPCAQSTLTLRPQCTDCAHPQYTGTCTHVHSHSQASPLAPLGDNCFCVLPSPG